ncbi:EAL domain-containing protein [Altererythrobacter sp. HHU K3-1]|uniref:EAL domain-containing protein n=2 Tax=Qipengyuania atrilutea TaxID=2744473 RepID=A0A850H3Y9_9SPHN|nr:EAL domain-containing protein [Actirhodobacter atriluteus]
MARALSIEESIKRELLVRRLDAVMRAAPLGLFASLVSVLVLAASLVNVVNAFFILGWTLVSAASIFHRAWLLRDISLGQTPLPDLERLWKRVNRAMHASSAGWAISLVVAASVSSGLALTLVVAVGTGIFVSALLMCRHAPAAAQVHVTLLCIGFLVAGWIVAGETSLIFSLLILAYAFTLLRSISIQERTFVASVRHEVERAESASTVRMLLNDYEEHSSDWLWTVDKAGKLLDVSRRFGQAAARVPANLEGQSFLELFEQGSARSRLAEHLNALEAFRELVVPIKAAGETRYWELSARPRENGMMSGVARDVTDTQLAEQRVSQMAHFDGLTGLANRYLFNERLRSALDRAWCEKRNVVLFYLDLDDFKGINDTKGHVVGDLLLCEVGARLQLEVRPDDLVARLGGDEFAILIETSAGDATLMERAHRFLTVMRAPFEIDGIIYRISTSVGVARCADADCNALELLRQADLALYAAKAKGRDQFALFDPSLDDASRDRRIIEQQLREAIVREELVMHYQPVVSLATGALTGYEALVRWKHPERGLLHPNAFLDVAETSGLIVPLGEWITHCAMMDAARWPDNLRVAINLSPTQVKSPRLASAVSEAIEDSGIDPARVDFEITEHVILDGSEANQQTLIKLREMGTSISLDDFGTGYSSLSYLRKFPFDRIKIDRDFVTEVAESRSSQAIVTTITRLADALGMTTIAEGVERPEQLELLRRLGCTEAQGFLICEPLPAGRLSGAALDTSGLGEPEEGILDYRRKRDEARGRTSDSDLRA